MGKTIKYLYFTFAFLLLALIVSLFIARPFVLQVSEYDKYSMNKAVEVKVDKDHDDALYLVSPGTLPGPNPTHSYVFGYFERNGKRLPYTDQGYVYNAAVADYYYYWFNDEDVKTKDTAKFSAVYFSRFNYNLKLGVQDGETYTEGIADNFNLTKFEQRFYTYSDSDIKFSDLSVTYNDPDWTKPRIYNIRFYLDRDYQNEVLSFGDLIKAGSPKNLYILAILKK